MKRSKIILSAIITGVAIPSILTLSANGINAIKPILTPTEINKEYEFAAGGNISIATDIAVENLEAIKTAHGTISTEFKNNNSEETKQFFNFSDGQLITSTETPSGNYNFTYEVCNNTSISSEKVTGGFMPGFEEVVIIPPPEPDPAPTFCFESEGD